jgi:ABC-type glycerol-3-phosphate transport system permease component
MAHPSMIDIGVSIVNGTHRYMRHWYNNELSPMTWRECVRTLHAMPADVLACILMAMAIARVRHHLTKHHFMVCAYTLSTPLSAVL